MKKSHRFAGAPVMGSDKEKTRWKAYLEPTLTRDSGGYVHTALTPPPGHHMKKPFMRANALDSRFATTPGKMSHSLVASVNEQVEETPFQTAALRPPSTGRRARLPDAASTLLMDKKEASM